MHSYLKAVGFSKIKKRTEMKEIILDVIRNYDEKNLVEDHPDGLSGHRSNSKKTNQPGSGGNGPFCRTDASDGVDGRGHVQ